MNQKIYLPSRFGEASKGDNTKFNISYPVAEDINGGVTFSSIDFTCSTGYKQVTTTLLWLYTPDEIGKGHQT